MSQHDYELLDQTRTSFRADLNAALLAIVSQNSGATEPASRFAYQWWADTTTGLLKIRNAANNAWITVGTLASAYLGNARAGANSDITSLSAVTSITGMTTPLSVAQGGTGATTLAANNVLLGNGTSAPQAVAPGASGNVLTSNGTTWQSAAPGVSGAKTLDTKQAASGAAVSFSSIPSGVKKITVMFEGVSLTGLANYLVQIGDSGGLETSGYLASSVIVGVYSGGFTTGFGIVSYSVPGVLHGAMVLTLMDASTNTWIASYAIGRSDTNYVVVGGGSKSLSGVLDRLSVLSGGAPTFNAGNINIAYEY